MRLFAYPGAIIRAMSRAITYTPGQIGVKAESTATAVPVFIDIQHQ